jgi:ABC-2 type transport system permease protein
VPLSPHVQIPPFEGSTIVKELSPVPPDVLAVEARDLRKEFVRKDRRHGRRSVAALADVSLEVARGECVAILGQNGSGKSTLVRLLSTLLLPDGGSARVFGYDVVRRDKDVRRLVNRVSVEASFFKKMSPSENLHYAARFYGMTPAETRERIPEILERVGFPPDRRGEPMENLSRAMHLGGSGVFAVLYGLVRAILLFVVVAAFFGLQFDDANFAAALVILVVASVSFFGIGMMTAVLPLISPEKGAQLGFVAQGMLLVVSGVYYPVEVLPGWMQWLAKISPATYALDGIRAAILDGASLGDLWHDIWPLVVIGAASIPLGLAIFNRGEVYAKRHGKLKRSG